MKRILMLEVLEEWYRDLDDTENVDHVRRFRMRACACDENYCMEWNWDPFKKQKVDSIYQCHDNWGLTV